MSSFRHVEHCISRQLAHKRLNAFVSHPHADALRSAAQQVDSKSTRGPLVGKLISLKDNIASPSSVREPTSCASFALDGYVSPYPSTVSKLLEEAGALVAGKTNMDEFGMGSHSQSSRCGVVINHLSRGAGADALSAGGSSGGSAVAVATGQCWAALGTDTGGSVRLPAAWTGTVGFKPSYGRVSRWGVVDYANSLDTVGWLATSISDAWSVYKTLDMHDPQDPTSLTTLSRDRIFRTTLLVDSARTASSVLPDRSPDRLRIGIPREYNTTALSDPAKAAWTATLLSLQSRGHTLVPISLPSTSLALSAYYVLAPAEAASNLARYDGVRYGHRSSSPDSSSVSPLFSSTRADALGPEVRRRILLGSYTLSSAAYDNYFLQAQRVRRLIQSEFNHVFTMPHPLLHETQDLWDGHGKVKTALVKPHGVDVIISPTAMTLPPTLKDVAGQTPVEKYVGDVGTVPGSLAGLPAVSVPVEIPGGGNGEVKTVGMQVMGQYGDDETVLLVGGILEGLAKGMQGTAEGDVRAMGEVKELCREGSGLEGRDVAEVMREFGREFE
ncbi:Glutamyl-tRNA(Gln) amidotransferase subunit A, mitochondrial [Sphaceloma murrayae]|uniref:Glutamyl-tRNA(Gln) amidotransferase subunit A, mitochondrial n=1 Tax=Sphaceloma murrayae TaxID=2082308 RepID=A0A2K1R0D7_9PEZI|nr:Glutamyl-tRNA(Gln) amidotransferase subunit A, mitochondrial [Sphaceloma murrayae]